MKHYWVVLACLLILPRAYAASVDTTPSPSASPSPVPVFVANPESIRHQLLENNISVIGALNRVHDAKDQINASRAKLLPSISLGSALSFVGGNFALSAVQILLPFIMPSNWLDMYEQKELFESQVLAYRILELNAYGSGLSMYYTVLADQQYQRIYQDKYDDLQQIYRLLKKESDVLNIIAPEDLSHALAQAEMAEVQASQMAEMVAQEIAALRSALGLPLTTAITVEGGHSMPVSDWENKTETDALAQAIQIAPESQQIKFLIAAAKDAKWSTALSFINSATIGSQSAGNSNASFSGMHASGNVSLGFGMFPAFELSDRNIQEVKLQQVSLQEEYGQVIEAGLKSLSEASKQIELAKDAEAAMENVYRITEKKYQFGLETYMDVLLARTQMADASVARVKAQMDLDLQRVTLHRTMVTDQFAQVQGCMIQPRPNVRKSFKEWFTSFFHRSPTSHKTLDQVCREGGHA